MIPRRRVLGRRCAMVSLASAGIVGPAALAAEPPGSETALSFLSGPDVALEGARIRERRTGAALTLAERVMAEHAIGVAVRYDYTRFVYHGLATRNRDLHRLVVPLTWRDLDGGWNVELGPTVATSSNIFKNLPERGSRRDVDLHGRVEYRVDRDRGLGWRLGVKRDTAFGEPRLYPTTALIWRDPRWHLELGLPSTLVQWRLPGSLTIGSAVFPDGNRWHVISDERGGASFDYRVRTWRAALSVGWEPSRPLRVGLHAGLAFHRRHRFEDDTGAQIDRRAATARFWGLELALRF